MTDEKRQVHPSRINHKRPKWLEELSSPEAEEYIRQMVDEARKRPEPSLEEVRAILDRALGNRTTADLIDEIRGKPFPDRISDSSERA
ncbi:MAG: hypothetical protein F4Y49_15490 [Dehalococcoidia bacterium]|nr:hypothetical protein [Dehalococcoidia bacterium]MXY22723.1 hypothetical protein [Dehalococcoidia bacterium]